MKSFKRKLFFSAVLILIMRSNVFADDIELEKIVVTVSRAEDNRSSVARNVDVVTKKDIERSQEKDLAQVLNDITSVNISDYGELGAAKTIKMRGSTSSQVLVLVDGRPINNPRDGAADLSAIPLDNVERVEVVHGPGSDLYGAGAMAGTLNIITKNPPKKKQETELYSGFGTFRTYTERFSHGARVSKFGYLIAGEYQNSEGFRTNSEFDAKDVNTKLEYELDENNSLTLNSGFYRSLAGSPGSISSSDADDKQKNIRNFFDFNWVFKPDDTTCLSMKAYQNYDRLEFIENTAGSIFDVANNRDAHVTKVRGYDLQLNKQLFEKYQAICGFNYVGNFNNSTSSAKHKYGVRAGYLENRLDLFDRFKLNFGARIDEYSNFGTETNPSISFLYALKDNIKLHGSVSRSFRAPTFNDLYWPDQGWAKGNPSLKPEKGITKEIGVKTEINKYLGLDVLYYRSDYDNLINWVEESGVWLPKNVNSAVTDGIEFKNRIKIADNWNMDTGYTYLSAKDADSHKDLIYQPKHKADVSLRHNGLNDFAYEVKGQFTDKKFHDAENTIKVKRFFVLGLNVSKKFKSGITYFTSVENLLARKYQVIKDYPMPGFCLTSGLKLEF